MEDNINKYKKEFIYMYGFLASDNSGYKYLFKIFVINR